MRKNTREFKIGDIVEFRDLYRDDKTENRERGIVVRVAGDDELWIHWFTGEHKGKIEYFQTSYSVYWVVVLCSSVDSDDNPEITEKT